MELAIGRFENLIGGRWCGSGTGAWMEQVNPADGVVVSSVPKSDEHDAQAAVAAAEEAFLRADWAFNPRRRSAALFAWAARMKHDLPELARMLTLETGKPLSEARFEIGGAIGYLEYYAAATRTLYGSSTAVDQNSYSILAREPVGVVGVIVPWNYPITLLMRDLSPALAAGNTAVVKPASQTSGVTMATIKLIDGIEGFPPGVLNAVTGSGSVAGMSLVHDRAVDMISFTGGLDTGKTIMVEAAKTMKKLSLELGGKSPNVLFDDADLGKALPFAIKAIFTNAGQLCTVGSRLLVQEGIAGQVTEELKWRAENLRVGNGLDEKTEMGPVVSGKQLDLIMDYMEIGKQCAQTVTGGVRLQEEDLGKGYFLAPTIFKDPPNDSPVVQEEIFGPVLVVQAFKDEDEAVALANSTVFGLASAVWSRNVDRAMRTARRLRAGSVWVNTYNRLFPETETGGYKQSGIDRAGGIDGMLKYTEIKHICIDFNPPA
jgi:betaine-aldehyde dehydrogenase